MPLTASAEWNHHGGMELSNSCERTRMTTEAIARGTSARTLRPGRAHGRERGHVAATGLTSTSADGSRLDISLEAQPGTMTHIVSSSSTESALLLGLLVGLYPPEDGALTLDGTPVADLPSTGGRSPIVLVLKDPWIMSGTVADNITFGDPTVDRKRIDEVVELACLGEFIAEAPEGLNSLLGGDDQLEPTIGQRRRIALARALLRDPVVLLLEDPFGDLTTREETKMIKAINQAGRHRTTVVTTEHFDPAMFTTDQVLLLEDGRLQPVPPDGTRVALPGPPPLPDPSARLPEPAVAPPVRTGHRTVQSERLAAGDDLGHGYRVASLLHRGAVTDSWLAWHATSSTIVEAKLARSETMADAARDVLAVEFERARRLQHPGIARPIAAHLTEGRPFAVYERVAGPFVSQLIATTGAGAHLDTAALGTSVARTLAFIHRLGFVHLGVGVDVVKLTGPVATITDVADSRPIDAPQCPADDPARRAGLAPEQLAAEPASPAMDIYALGCLLFQAATSTVLTDEAGPDVSDIDAYLPPAAADAVASMLAPDPEQRPTASEVFGRLRPLVVTTERHRPIEPLASNMEVD